MDFCVFKTNCMDLQEQLKNLFPDHELTESTIDHEPTAQSEIQKTPLICQYERRKGKPVTIIEGFEGDENEAKNLAKIIKVQLSVGGSYKDGSMIFQGDYRTKIMDILKAQGYKVKRVGG